MATAGAVWGRAVSPEVHADLGILSDEAGQVNLLQQALGWVHAARTLANL